MAAEICETRAQKHIVFAELDGFLDSLSYWAGCSSILRCLSVGLPPHSVPSPVPDLVSGCRAKVAVARNYRLLTTLRWRIAPSSVYSWNGIRP